MHVSYIFMQMKSMCCESNGIPSTEVAHCNIIHRLKTLTSESIDPQNFILSNWHISKLIKSQDVIWCMINERDGNWISMNVKHEKNHHCVIVNQYQISKTHEHHWEREIDWLKIKINIAMRKILDMDNDDQYSITCSGNSVFPKGKNIRNEFTNNWR